MPPSSGTSFIRAKEKPSTLWRWLCVIRTVCATSKVKIVVYSLSKFYDLNFKQLIALLQLMSLIYTITNKNRGIKCFSWWLLYALTYSIILLFNIVVYNFLMHFWYWYPFNHHYFEILVAALPINDPIGPLCSLHLQIFRLKGLCLC